MTDVEQRHDQLTRAPKSTETDAAPRITLSEGTDGAILESMEEPTILFE